jgi:hypothetical protein
MNKQRYFSSAEVYDRARSWQFRVLLAAFPADPMGLIVRAVLGVNSRVGAALGLEATIRKDGVVTAALRSPRGRKVTNAHPLGTVIALRDEFRRLADHCRLPDNERLALFEEVRKWAGRDLREVDNRRV